MVLQFIIGLYNKPVSFKDCNINSKKNILAEEG